MNQEQEDELAALESIYGPEDCLVDRDEHSVQLWVPSRSSHPCVAVRALLVSEYPEKQAPVAEIEAAHWGEDSIASALAQLDKLFVPGSVVLYEWIEWLRETEEQWQANHGRRAPAQADTGAQDYSAEDTDEEGSSEDPDYDPTQEEYSYEAHAQAEARRAERTAAPTNHDRSLCDSVRDKIISGPTMTFKKSTFQAHVARIQSPQEAKAVVDVLLENNKIRSATHNIMAYRVGGNGVSSGTCQQDCDDDGETAAGGRLLHLLQAADVWDVVVVVSRWFGGVLLGPQRFALINNTARQLLEAQGYIKAADAGGKGHSKR